MAVEPPEQRHPAIRQWAGQLQELVDATDLSLRQLADHVPWSHSTLARYLNGERVVDEAWQLVPTLIELGKQRGKGLSVELHELRPVYVEARQAYQEQQRTNRSRTTQPVVADSAGSDSGQNGSKLAETVTEPDETTSEAEAAQPQSKLRHPVVKIAAGALSVVVILGAVGFLATPWLSPREIKVWQATIVGTWSQQYKQHLGVFRFRGPDLSGDTDRATYHEGTTVSIVCQSRNRRLVTDPTTGTASPVWNKLNDGYWIPDLYTDLPKVPGDAPPLGIPLCT